MSASMKGHLTTAGIAAVVALVVVFASNRVAPVKAVVGSQTA